MATVPICSLSQPFVAMAGDAHMGGEHFGNSVVGLGLQDFERKHSGKDIMQDTHELVPFFAGFDVSCSLYRARYEVIIKGLLLNFEVKALVGDSSLGAEDVDYSIAASSHRGFKHMHCGKDIMQDSLFVVSLIEGIEGACSLYRGRSEEPNKDVYRNAMGLVESCLWDGGFDWCNVHEGAVVYGSMRIPWVRSMNREFVDGNSGVEEFSLLLEILHLLFGALFFARLCCTVSLRALEHV